MKRRTGSKKVLRAMALALATAVFATSVPVTTLADKQDYQIEVIDDRGSSSGSSESSESTVTFDLSSNNLTEETKAIVVETKAADSASDQAATLAGQAATDANAAADFASVAETAANNANTIATAAENMLNALNDTDFNKQITDAADTSGVTEKYNDAVKAVKGENGVGGANNAIAAAEAAKLLVEPKITEANNATAEVNNRVDRLEGANGQKGLIEIANEKKGTASDKATGKAATGTELLIETAESKLATIKTKESEATTTKGDANSGLVKELNDVKNEVQGVRESYDLADSDAKKAIDDINTELTKSVINALEGKTEKESVSFSAEAAAKAKDNASTERDVASKQLTNTEDSFRKIEALVNSGSHDVEAAAGFAKDARTAADAAQQAAVNASAYADAAKAAEKVASLNYAAADNKYQKALADLYAVLAEYEAKYGALDGENGRAAVADGKVTTVNGKVDALNTAIDGIVGTNGLIAQYENARQQAVTGISETNTAIGEANTVYNEIYTDVAGQIDGKDATRDQIADAKINAANAAKNRAIGEDGKGGLVKDANDAISTANGKKTEFNNAKSAKLGENGALATAKNALDGKKALYEAAKKNADKAQQDLADEVLAAAEKVFETADDAEKAQKIAKLAKQEELTAEQWADLAQASADLAAENADKVKDDAIVAGTTKTLNDLLSGATQKSKDALAKRTNNGKTYQQLVNEKNEAWGNDTTSTVEGLTDKNSDLEKKTYPDKLKSHKNVAGVKHTYNYVINHSWKFSSSVVKEAEADKALHDKNEKKINTYNNLAKVDNFKYTPDMVLTVGTEDIESLQDYLNSFGDLEKKTEYQNLINSLNKDYGPGNGNKEDKSFKTVDSETTKYASCVGADWPWEAGYERELESKYGKWYQFLWVSDEAIYNNMKTIANEKAVIVCEDVDKLAVLRATFAQAKFEAAKSVATAANNKANAQRARVKDAEGKYTNKIQKEQQALNKYNELAGKLKNAENALADTNFPANDLKLTKERVEAGTYTAITAKKSVKSQIASAYGDTEHAEIRSGAHTYSGPVKFNESDKATYVGTHKKASLPVVVRSELPAEEGDLGDEQETKYIYEVTLTGDDVQGEDQSDLTQAQKNLRETIKTLKGLLEQAKKDLTIAGQELEQAQEDLGTANELYEAAQEDADKANKIANDAAELAKKVTPAPSDDDDDDDDDDDVVPGTPGGYAGLPGTSVDVITLTPVGGYDDELTAGGAGRGGRRGGNGAQDRGVAGVRVDDNNGAGKNTNPVVVKKTNDDDKDNGAQNLTKVETPEMPLAATPFKEDPVNPAIVGISIAALLAVLAGLYYEFNRRKKAKAEEMKKYKKN